MLSHKRKRTTRMGFAIEKRRFETRGAMTRRTIRTARARCKLPLVRILMTILAEFMCDRATEISFLVALSAGKGRMLSDQAKLHNAVIETAARVIAFESSGVVAARAPADPR